MAKQGSGSSVLRVLTALPLVGIPLYLLLYVLATFYYPGGTHLDKTTKGFSWMDNFWCNLMAPEALNGDPNTARPIALIAMVVMCISLALFWIVFPVYSGLRPVLRRLVQGAGILTMLLAALLFAGPHDTMVNIATGVGLIPLAGTFMGLRKLGWRRAFRYGLVLPLLIAANNLCYYTPALFRALPLVQKLTFLYFLGWIFALSFLLLRRKSVS